MPFAAEHGKHWQKPLFGWLIFGFAKLPSIRCLLSQTTSYPAKWADFGLAAADPAFNVSGWVGELFGF